MDYLNGQLHQLRQKVARKMQLQARIAGLRTQRSALQDKVAALDQNAIKEEADVARLEGRSLAAFFYNVVGKMDEKLDQERREAYAARVKYDAAVRELQAVELDLTQCGAELDSLSLCEEHYRMCLEEKAAAIKISGSADGFEILRLETCIQTLESQLKELHEALDAGEAALFMIKNVQSSLDSAEDLGTWDMFGGGLLVDMAKHDHLDDAQAMIEKLQVQLLRFRTELTDVKIDADVQISVDGLTRFADFFFDGLFADWAVMDRIEQAQGQVKKTRSQIEGVLSRLEGMIRMTRADMEKSRSDLDALIISA